MARRTTADPVEAIRRLYYDATPGTVQRDLTRAVALFKALDDDDRERAAVYMDGLSQMRSEWATRKTGRTSRRGTAKR